MDKETFLNKIKEIGTLEDDVIRRDKLTELEQELSPIFDKDQELEEENNKYKDEMEKLREANMKLFLRVGSEKTPEEVKQDQTGVKEEYKEPRKYEDLFDEKGNLK